MSAVLQDTKENASPTKAMECLKDSSVVTRRWVSLVKRLLSEQSVAEVRVVLDKEARKEESKTYLLQDTCETAPWKTWL